MADEPRPGDQPGQTEDGRAWPRESGGWRPRAWRGPTPRYQGQFGPDGQAPPGRGPATEGWATQARQPEPGDGAGARDSRHSLDFRHSLDSRDQPGPPVARPWPGRRKALAVLLTAAGLLAVGIVAWAVSSSSAPRAVAGAGSQTRASTTRSPAATASPTPRPPTAKTTVPPAASAPARVTAVPRAAVSARTTAATTAATSKPASPGASASPPAPSPMDPASPSAPSPTDSASPTETETETETASPTSSPTRSCYPRSGAGNCFKAGESCPKADHGASGVGAGGNPIVCEDKDGVWRWRDT